MNKYISLESAIRSLGAKSASQPLEKDMNDQVHAGSYSSKNFEVSAPAQKLFANLPKSVSTDSAQKSLQLHDQLFDIHKKVKASGRSSSADIDAARMLHDKILKIARDMDLEDKHGHVKDSLDFIQSKLEADGQAKSDVNPSDAEKRFGTPPKDYQSDVKSDSDIDNIAKFKISRDKNAQRKLKIIDDEFKPGETTMSSISDALKQVLANEEELTEKKKMSKADIAALKHPKGKIDANDLAALRAGEHKKKVAEEAKKHNNTPKGIECPVCGMEACPPVKEETLDELSDPTKAAYAMKAAGQIMKYTKDNSAYDTSAAGEKKTKDVQKRIKGLQTLQKSIEKKKVEEETLDEAQFVMIIKGSEHKRIRNNPIEIARARKEGWAISEETVSEASPMKALGAQQKKSTIQREVQQKKAMYSKKDAVDKQKFSKSMQKIHAGDEVEMNGEQIDEAAFKLSDAHKSAITKHLKNNYGKGKVTFHSEHGGHFATHSDGIQSTVHHAEMKNGKLTLSHFMTMDESVDKKTVFMERAIALLGEEFADASYETLVEEVVKRGRGRPRKDGSTGPKPAPTGPKRGRGRPRKDAGSSASGAAKKPEEAGDREHILMALRKSVSLRGQHHVKFANGDTHQVSAEHATKAMRIHDSLSKPSEKMVYQRKLGASHDSFKKALADKNPGGDDTKKTGITLAKRAD